MESPASIRDPGIMSSIEENEAARWVTDQCIVDIDADHKHAQIATAAFKAGWKRAHEVRLEEIKHHLGPDATRARGRLVEPYEMPRRRTSPAELSRAVEALVRGLPVLLECDKGMVGYFYSCLRGRLRQQQIRCTYIDGRAAPQPGQMPMGLVQTMIGQLRDAVRGGVQGDNEQRHVMVLPHLDLLTTSSGGLTSEAREVVALLYENPNILWLGFRDPSFPLPKVISDEVDVDRIVSIDANAPGSIAHISLTHGTFVRVRFESDEQRREELAAMRGFRG